VVKGLNPNRVFKKLRDEERKRLSRASLNLPVAEVDLTEDRKENDINAVSEVIKKAIKSQCPNDEY